MAKQTRTATTRPTFMDQLMAEPIRLPGCPQIIVTRGFVYTFFRDELGYDTSARGFASLDYLVFRHAPVSEPLTDMNLPEVQNVLALMKSHAA